MQVADTGLTSTKGSGTQTPGGSAMSTLDSSGYRQPAEIEYHVVLAAPQSFLIELCAAEKGAVSSPSGLTDWRVPHGPRKRLMHQVSPYRHQ